MKEEGNQCKSRRRARESMICEINLGKTCTSVCGFSSSFHIRQEWTDRKELQRKAGRDESTLTRASIFSMLSSSLRLP